MLYLMAVSANPYHPDLLGCRLAQSMLGLLLLASSMCAQDYFPATIPTSELEVYIIDVAALPDSDSGNNAPARMSLLSTDPSGRIFVNDQRGPLYWLDFSGGTPASVTEYLDLRDYTALQLKTTTGEQGFQAFAFHPDFATTGTSGYGCFYTIHSSSSAQPWSDFTAKGMIRGLSPGLDSFFFSSLWSL